MSTKNKHNQQLGSDIERVDDRIRRLERSYPENGSTDDRFIVRIQLKNDMFLDYCAGNGNFSSVLIDRGVPQSHIYGVEIWRIISLNCNRLGIDDPCYKLVKPSGLTMKRSKIPLTKLS